VKLRILNGWTIFLLIGIMSCNGGNEKKETKTAAAYTYPTPDKWETEKINFPIDFAPDIPFKGTEDLRFAPGWASTSSDEHWAYAFLWWLEGNPDIDENVMARHLKTYYTGLVGRNITEKKIPSSKVTSITTSVTKIATAPRDLATYEGKITMTDYNDILFSPITLNCLIHKKQCGNHLVMICLISPRSTDHTVWKSLNGLEEGFKCGE